MPDPDDTNPMLAFASTVPPSAPDTIPVLQDPEHDGFAIGYNLKPVTFLPTPVHVQTEGDLFDLAAEELDDE